METWARVRDRHSPLAWYNVLAVYLMYHGPLAIRA